MLWVVQVRVMMLWVVQMRGYDAVGGIGEGF